MLDLTRTGLGIIEGCRQIVDEREWAKINGVKVDVYTAASILTVFDAAATRHKEAFLALPVASMANVAFRVIG